MDLNPFESVIVSEPRRIDTPVPGLNDAPLARLTRQLDKLSGGDFPRAVKLSGAQFIKSPAPGYGKSHLIGRLFKALRGRATLIYQRPYTNASTCWKSILLTMVQEFEFPESAAAEFCGENEAPRPGGSPVRPRRRAGPIALCYPGGAEGARGRSSAFLTPCALRDLPTSPQ
jgi:hypothetical protein